MTDIAQVTEKVAGAKTELAQILKETQNSSNLTLGWDRFKRWKERTAKVLSTLISPDEAEKFEDASPRVFSMTDPWGNFQDELEHHDSHLTALLEDIKNNPEFVIATNTNTNSEAVIAPTPSPLARLENLCGRFHRVANQLRSRYSNRQTIQIEDEYDVQDLFHALLKIEFDDIRKEEWTPRYAGGNARTDFLLKQEKVIIETKKTRKGLEDKELGDQLIIDIDRYQAHPDCKALVCFVYDPEGRIANPQGIIRDLEERHKGSLDLKIIIEPRA